MSGPVLRTRRTDAIIAWQQRAHGAVVESFELTITAEARRLFKANTCPA